MLLMPGNTNAMQQALITLWPEDHQHKDDLFAGKCLVSLFWESWSFSFSIIALRWRAPLLSLSAGGSADCTTMTSKTTFRFSPLMKMEHIKEALMLTAPLVSLLLQSKRTKVCDSDFSESSQWLLSSRSAASCLMLTRAATGVFTSFNFTI